MKNQFLATFLIAAFLVSCEIYPQDDYEEYYVVESYLVANRQLPHIRLSTTVPATQFYDFGSSAISNAIIEVRLLQTGPQSAASDTFTYSHFEPGIYLPDQNHKVLPLRTYQLHVSFPDNQDIVKAHTVVPDTFRILDANHDTVIYQSSEQFEITVSESSYPGRQNIFVFNALSQNPVPENLTPFYEGFYEESENPEKDLVLFANNNSGIINEGNFEINPDGSFTISYPWIGVAFYKYNRIVANTLDDNVYDFVRSQQVQLGGSTLSPGEIPNLIYHVEGGIGVFGAVASDTVQTYVKPPEF